MRENRKFDITRRDNSDFGHYQLLVKVLRGEHTEHHTLDVFTAEREQLNEMRRLYAFMCSCTDYTARQRLARNN